MPLRTLQDVADELHISTRTLRGLIAQHKPPIIEAGRRKLFDDRALAALIESMRYRSSRPSMPARVSAASTPSSSEEVYERARALIAKALGEDPVPSGNAAPRVKHTVAKRANGNKAAGAGSKSRKI